MAKSHRGFAARTGAGARGRVSGARWRSGRRARAGRVRVAGAGAWRGRVRAAEPRQAPRVWTHASSAALERRQGPREWPGHWVYFLKVACLHPSPLRGGRGVREPRPTRLSVSGGNQPRPTRRELYVSGGHAPVTLGATKVLTVAREAGARETNSGRRGVSRRSLGWALHPQHLPLPKRLQPLQTFRSIRAETLPLALG